MTHDAIFYFGTQWVENIFQEELHIISIVQVTCTFVLKIKIKNIFHQECSLFLKALQKRKLCPPLTYSSTCIYEILNKICQYSIKKVWFVEPSGRTSELYYIIFQKRIILQKWFNLIVWHFDVSHLVTNCLKYVLKNDRMSHFLVKKTKLESSFEILKPIFLS